MSSLRLPAEVPDPHFLSARSLSKLLRIPVFPLQAPSTFPQTGSVLSPCPLLLKALAHLHGPRANVPFYGSKP